MAVTTDRLPVFTVLPSVNEKGASIFSVLVKRTYDIIVGQPASRAEEDKPLREIDEYFDGGDPQTCTVKHESDLAPYKLNTDVVVIGKAHAPDGEPTAQLMAGIRVGSYRKVVQVVGDRHCNYRQKKPPSFSDPVPFTEMELRYERAYGGSDEKSNPAMPFFYPRNHLGTGLALQNAAQQVDGLSLPNLEDPADLLTPERVVFEDPLQWHRQPLPQGFGWFQKTWYPRCSFVGSVPATADPDDILQEEKLGLVPQGQIALARQFKLPRFDLRFNNGASLGLALPYLQGNERVTLENMSEHGQFDFGLPGDPPRIMLDISLGENELPAVLHTLCIRPEDMQMDLVWRGAHEYPGVDWLPEMKRLRAEVT